MSPSKSRYSSGWSSVWTARRLSLGSSGSPFGHREGHERAVALEAQVPVQARRVVLLDDEPRRPRAPRARVAGGLRGGREIALAPVGLELVGHCSPRYPRGGTLTRAELTATAASVRGGRRLHFARNLGSKSAPARPMTPGYARARHHVHVRLHDPPVRGDRPHVLAARRGGLRDDPRPAPAAPARDVHRRAPRRRRELRRGDRPRAHLGRPAQRARRAARRDRAPPGRDRGGAHRPRRHRSRRPATARCWGATRAARPSPPPCATPAATRAARRTPARTTATSSSSCRSTCADGRHAFEVTRRPQPSRQPAARRAPHGHAARRRRPVRRGARVLARRRARARAQPSHRAASARRRDGLTDLPNQRAFQDDLAAAVADGRAPRRPAGARRVDLDDFKFLNDRHGHPHGDALLRRVAAVLRDVRAGDAAYRIGGDEFALVLPPHRRRGRPRGRRPPRRRAARGGPRGERRRQRAAPRPRARDAARRGRRRAVRGQAPRRRRRSCTSTTSATASRSRSPTRSAACAASSTRATSRPPSSRSGTCAAARCSASRR